MHALLLFSFLLFLLLPVNPVHTSSVTFTTNSSLRWSSLEETELSDLSFSWRTVVKDSTIAEVFADNVTAVVVQSVNNTLQLQLFDDVITTDVVVADGRWHNFSVVFDPLLMTVDGEEVETTSSTNTTINGSLTIAAGGRRSHYFGCFAGFRVADFTLPLENISDSSNSSLPFILTMFDGITTNCTQEDLCAVNHCQNNGSCVQNDWNIASCDCPERFTGDFCEIEDFCGRDKVCNGQGSCSQNSTDFTCHCDLNWTGKQCDERVDWCSNVHCLNGGECGNGNGSFICNCSLGYSGRLCEAVDCDQVDCNHGNCDIANSSTWQCNCSAGWTGNLCADNVDQCLSSPCQNGGTCVDLPGPKFNCSCPQAVSGAHCQLVAIDSSTNKSAMVTGLAIGFSIILLIIVVLLIAILVRRLSTKRAFSGVYKPGREETSKNMMLQTVMKPPPEERLI